MGVEGSSSQQGLQESTKPERVRKYLELTWGRDGLTFAELDRKLPEATLVHSKEYNPALKPVDLLHELRKVEIRLFDMDSWNSSSFCFHLIGQGSGMEYEYR